MKNKAGSRLSTVLGVVLLMSTLGASYSFAGSPEEISGAFGYKLGAVFDPWPALSRDKVSITNVGEGQIEVAVTPPEPNPLFTGYTLRVDQKTHKICQITAKHASLGQDVDIEILKKIIQVLTAKYGEPVYDNRFTTFSTKDREVVISPPNEGITIFYRDKQLDEELGKRITNEAVDKVTADGF